MRRKDVCLDLAHDRNLVCWHAGFSKSGVGPLLSKLPSAKMFEIPRNIQNSSFAGVPHNWRSRSLFTLNQLPRILKFPAGIKADMPPKGAATTTLKPMRLPPLHKLKVRRPNEGDANPCLSIMSSVLSTFTTRIIYTALDRVTANGEQHVGHQRDIMLQDVRRWRRSWGFAWIRRYVVPPEDSGMK